MNFSTKKDEHRFLKRREGALKKAVFTIFLCSFLTVGAGASQASAAEGDFNNIFHVYVEDDYIGYTLSKEAIQNVIDEKELKASTQYKGFSVDAGSNVTIVPEQVFEVEDKQLETLEKLEKAIVVQTDAYAIEIDGKAVAFVKDQASYEKTIEQLKLEYVSEKELDELNASFSSVDSLPQLKAGETRLTSLEFSKALSSSETEVEPNQVLTPEKAVKAILKGKQVEKKYVVVDGDSQESIIKKFEMSSEQFDKLNGSKTNLKVGQEVKVLKRQPLINVEIEKETATTQVVKYKLTTKNDATMFKGDTKVTKKGVNGKKQITVVTKIVNGKTISKSNTQEKIITKAINEVKVVGTKEIPSRGSGQFIWPADGGYISSKMGPRWGEFHRGIDIARPTTKTIKASDNGVVTAAGWLGSYGNHVKIDHKNGYTTLYAHLETIDVSVGQVVGQGAKLGIMGTTGNSTGIHLHFEVQKNGELVNPLSYVKQ